MYVNDQKKHSHEAVLKWRYMAGSSANDAFAAKNGWIKTIMCRDQAFGVHI